MSENIPHLLIRKLENKRIFQSLNFPVPFVRKHALLINTSWLYIKEWAWWLSDQCEVCLYGIAWNCMWWLHGIVWNCVGTHRYNYGTNSNAASNNCVIHPNINVHLVGSPVWTKPPAANTKTSRNPLGSRVYVFVLIGYTYSPCMCSICWIRRRWWRVASGSFAKLCVVQECRCNIFCSDYAQHVTTNNKSAEHNLPVDQYRTKQLASCAWAIRVTSRR